MEFQTTKGFPLRLGVSAVQNHFAVFQIEINPPRPHSNSTLTAIAPLFRNSRQKFQRQCADGRANAIAQTNRRFVDAAVLAACVAGVHRVKQRGIINQPNRAAEKDLRRDEHINVRRHKNCRERRDENCKRRHQPAKFVMPFCPMPQRDKCAEPHETPERANKSREHRRELKLRRDAGNDGDERVDCDIGERIRQPRHIQKRLCFWRRWLMRFRWRRGHRFFNCHTRHFYCRDVAARNTSASCSNTMASGRAKIILNPNFSMSVPPMKNADALVTAQTTL